MLDFKIDIDKTELKLAGIFSGILLFLFLFVFLMIFLSKNSWNKGLQNAVNQCLAVHFQDEYEIVSDFKINSGFSTSAKAFLVNSKIQKENKVALLINVTTLYGQYPALFLAALDGDTDFVTFLNMPDNFIDTVSSISMKSTIYYWQKRIPFILGFKDFSNDE